MKQATQYDTLEIYVTQQSQQQQTYYVKVEHANGSTVNGQIDLASPPLPPTGTSPNDIATYGLCLFETLLPGQLAHAFHWAWAAAQANQRGVRLRLWLDSTDPRLHAIPWELMHFDTSNAPDSLPTPIATDNSLTFSRYLTSSAPTGTPITQRPITMLAVISGPDDLHTKWQHLTPIDEVAYRDELREQFHTMCATGDFAVDFLPSDDDKQHSKRATIEHLHAALDSRESPYHIMLYFGHALAHPTLGTRLLLVDDTQQSTLYDGQELVRRMKAARDTRPGIIMLIACNTATEHISLAKSISEESLEQSLSSLAAQLVQEGGVPAVLAMQRLVDKHTAQIFTHYISDELLRHGCIDVAVAAARRYIYQSSSIEWSTPVLYMRYADGQLISPNPRIEYAHNIAHDERFVQWRGNDTDFIDIEVATVPPWQDWSLLQQHPEDAPLTETGITALYSLITQQSPHTLHRRAPAATTPYLPNVIALIGLPHGGQTVMLLRFTIELADALCRERIDQNDTAKSASQTPLGIFVPLKEYENQRASSHRLQQLIIDTVNQFQPSLATALSQLFHEARYVSAVAPNTTMPPAPQHTTPARYVFLLDGLNELEETQRGMAVQDIVKLANILPNEYIVVGCTQQLLPYDLSRYCTVMVMQPINERVILRYLQRRNREQSNEIFRNIIQNRLLDLTTDPVLLTIIYHHFAEGQHIPFTRNQLAMSYLEHALKNIPAPYTYGNAAYQTLITIAWHMRWHHQTFISISELFSLMAEVRQHRDYHLETLYQHFIQHDLLLQTGTNMVRFVHPLLHSFCAALHLFEQPDWMSRVNDIIIMASVPERMRWWEEILYALVGMRDAPRLLCIVANAAHNWGGAHRVLAARCVALITQDVFRAIPTHMQQKLFDVCLVGIESNREPIIEHRVNIVTALGSINYPSDNHTVPMNVRALPLVQTVERELIRLLTCRVRWTPYGHRYDYIEVRIAAARALRTRYALFQQEGTGNWCDIARHHQEYDTEAIAPERMEMLLAAWVHDDRATLRAVVRDDAMPSSERAVATFALGDMRHNEDDDDVQTLIDVIMQPRDDETYEDICWAATDAITLFDARQVARLLSDLFQRMSEFPEYSTQQLAYIAGRVRAQDTIVIVWLMKLLMQNTDLMIKAKALQSLAWLGETVQTFDWLTDAITTPDIQAMLHALGIDNVQTQPRKLVHDVVLNIASWHLAYLHNIGFVKDVGPLPPDESIRIEQEIIYLRRKAIEALAWIGDSHTVETIQQDMYTWDIQLRESWYTTTTLITARTSNNPEQLSGIQGVCHGT